MGGGEEAEKVGKIVKTGASAADTVIGVDLALKDCAKNDYFCTALDIIGTLASATGMVLGNIPKTKGLTTYTGSITVCYRTVRIYCQKYGTFWGCTAATAGLVKEGAQNFIKYKVPTDK